jgi:hypothetical protein
MVKTTYVINTIGIPTHGVDGFQLVKRNPKSPIEPPQVERARGRKKERGRKIVIDVLAD